MSCVIPRTKARMVLMVALSMLAFQAIADETDNATLPWHIQILPVPSKTFTAAELLRGGAAGGDGVHSESKAPVAHI